MNKNTTRPSYANQRTKSDPHQSQALARLSGLHDELQEKHDRLASEHLKSLDLANLKLEVYQGFDEVKDLWCRFEQHASCFVYQQFSFCRNWYESVGKQQGFELHIVVASDWSGNPLMLVPLCLKKGHFGTVVHFAGDGMADYLAPLVQKDFAAAVSAADFTRLWQKILDSIQCDIDMVWLDRQPIFINGVKNPMTHLPHFNFASKSYALNFPQQSDQNLDWGQCARQLRSNKTAKKIERRVRQLAKLGPVELIEIAGATDRKKHLDTLLTLKVENLDDAGILHRMNKPDVRRFYQGLVSDPACQDNICQFELLCGGKLVASVLGFVQHDTFYYQVCAFNRKDFAQNSPGSLLQYMLFDKFYSRGLKRFDMTIGDESYKQDWSNDVTRLVTVAAICSTRGRLHYMLNRGLLALKSYVKKAPAVRRLALFFT